MLKGNSWRPDGWNNPFDIEGWDSYGYYNSHQLSHVAFESGADAMLEGLRNRGNRVTLASNGWYYPNVPIAPMSKAGILVFIPDDKE